MPRQTPYLQLRGNTYWFRVRVPEAIRASVGKTEITRSLRTSDRKEASRLARLEHMKLDGEWEELKRRAQPQQFGRLADRDILNLVSKWFVKATGRLDHPPSSTDGDEQRPSHTDALRDLQEVSSWELMSPHLFGVATRLLEENYLKADADTPEFLHL